MKLILHSIQHLLQKTALFFLILLPSISIAATPDSIPVTLREGTNMAIALSPDKKTIAMDLQGTIWVIPSTGGKAKALTDAVSDNRQPVWSPDGNQIAFQSYRSGDYHIWTVNNNGKGLKQLTFGIYDDREPYWSPDGNEIIFSSDRSGNYDIWKVELASGKLTQLTKDADNDYYPAYSPDGRKIVFLSERDSAPGIYTIDANGKEELLHKSSLKLSAPTWSPASAHVIFNELAGGKSLLKRIAIGNTESGIISDTSEDVFPFRISWISDDEFLYTSDGKIKQKKIDQNVSRVLPFEASVFLNRPSYKRKVYDFNVTAPQNVKGIRSPKVSPDGSQVVFTALGDIWLKRKGESKPVRITNGSYIEIDPAWSPDGKQITYTSDRNGNMDIWIHNLKTNEDRCLLDLPDPLKFPVWSVDGNSICFYQPGPGARGLSELNMINVTTGTISNIHKAVSEGGYPSWAPDGKHLVLSAEEPYSSRFREGINKFLVVAPDGKPAEYISPVPGVSLGTRGVNGPIWSPDGKMMAYIQNGLLWAVPVDTAGKLAGSPRQLTNVLAEAPSWTGDSKSIVFLATDTLKQVYLSDGHIEPIAMNLKWNYQQPIGEVIIHAGRVFDGRDSNYRKNVDIIITGNRVSKIVPHLSGRKGKIIDASNKTVIPGLFEMHTHQNDALGEQMGRLWLSYGITSIREPGTDPYDAVERKEAWASGSRVGPRTFIAGAHMEGNRVYYNRNLSTNSIAGIELELKRAVSLGYDMIKTYVRMPDQSQQWIIAYAHARGIPVSSHEIYPAVSFGIDGIEHMGASSRRGYSPKLSALNFSYQDVSELIIKSGVVFTPTASLHGGLYKQAMNDPAFFQHRQFAAFYSEKIKSGIKASGAQMLKNNPAFFSQLHNIQSTIKTVLAGGGRVTTGTDSPIIPSGLSLHAELQCWVDGGITPYETLRSATLWSAEAAGAGKDLGSIEEGKLADLVIVDGDPLKNIKDVLNVEVVFKNGIQYNIDELLNNKADKPKNLTGVNLR